MNGIAKIFVIREGVVRAIMNHPPRIRTPEQASIIADCTIHIQGRCEIRELKAIVQIKRRRHLSTYVNPLADIQAIPHQSAPIRAVRTCIQIDARGPMVTQSILEGGISLLMINAWTHFQRRVAIELAITHRSRKIRNLRNSPD